MKISIIGAGNVGATAANVIALKNIASDVVLLDVKEGVAEGKSTDMMQELAIMGSNTRIVGCTNDYKKTSNSDIIIITSGIARKPGMKREELIGINAGIMKGVVNSCTEYSPEAIYIIVSNPADTLTYLTIKHMGLPRNKVIGMSGVLDSSRFVYYLSRAIGCHDNDVDGMVIGVHGDFMLPLTRFAFYKGIPVNKLLDKSVISEVCAKTKDGGGILTQLLGTSAWYAPGAAIATMAEAIAKDTKKLLSCITYLDGEYKNTDVCAAVPVILGRAGMERIVDLELNAEEQALFNQSTAASKQINKMLK
ncbi:malate dehydrogenase [Propionispora vibrioides]|uniref:L-lactate dehydrogenase n=1 Tax=Propionispora vibrioides TaxID=112903 RepID=A0A1H8XMC9_9FIRM|nr:malate dehydrogenase [Propionispora vibrioides]SEP41035.1 malate dehydrogenase (NAD) [Propionispora vibrioides]